MRNVTFYCDGIYPLGGRPPGPFAFTLRKRSAGSVLPEESEKFKALREALPKDETWGFLGLYCLISRIRVRTSKVSLIKLK